MSNTKTDPRRYWREQMDEAHAFMSTIMDWPVTDNLEPLVPLKEAARQHDVPLLFSDLAHVQGLPRLFYLRESLIEPFFAAVRSARKQGWLVLVEDAYRTTRMQRGLGQNPVLFKKIYDKTLWEYKGQAPPAELILRRLSALIAIAPKVGTHTSGSAMDLSLVDEASGQLIDRGGPYLEMSEKTPLESPFISQEGLKNRRLFSRIMLEQGFVAYPYEFWHYSSGDAYAEFLNPALGTARFGAVELNQADGSVSPLANPKALLQSQQDMLQMVQQIV